MTHLLLVAATVGLLGMTSGQLQAPPGMAELLNTATLYPQIGVVAFFLLSVFAVLRAAGKSPRW